MEPYIYKDCGLPDQNLPHGAELCESENCKVCVDGQLVEKENLVEKLQW
jgi:hypothetical protein